jgi:5-formyltetrahydrofolate cyclo-ligase
MDAMTKTDLRRDVRAVRKAFVAGLDTAARETLERALADHAMPALAGSRLVGSYAAMGDEIDPVWIEKRIGPHAFPRVAGPDIRFHIAEWRDMKPGFQGIPEPPADAAEVQPDVLLVPLLAVSPSGVRLGQGRGYYDRAIARLRAAGPLTAIGLAWDCQLVPAVPADAWDMPLDLVATPTRLVDCRKYR